LLYDLAVKFRGVRLVELLLFEPGRLVQIFRLVIARDKASQDSTQQTVRA
jgi:hypothetical protein